MKAKQMRAGHIAATTILVLGLAACSADTDTEETPGAALSHIHGLGIDPADGRLYVATHEGIFTPGKDGKAQLVGDSKDDFMGFAVAKAKTFLASGHPAPAATLPETPD
ncbi:hypothetical protein AB0K02_27730 [Streptomyces sp. NPDC049597]|uniref:hypothetical protein n=1 Tax=Streptomyces sp. NPDC049597 TaxID=3155276 RepID=UPI0034483693